MGQDSNLVVRRIIDDTIGIVSHDPTVAHLLRRLAGLGFAFPTATRRASGSHVEQLVIDRDTGVTEAEIRGPAIGV